jgi:APA family basic amino acid/polyamine antiporter
MAAAELPRKLGLIDAASIVVGTVIGSAIFLVPSSVARSLPSTGSILLVWIGTGLLSFFGALAYAELGAMMPATGGQYVYLREAYGPMCAFLCGWSYFLVTQAGGVATLLIGFVTLVNYRGVRLGAGVQNLFTSLKLAGIAILVFSAFFTRGHSGPAPSAASEFTWSQFGVAMIACLWAYEGWNCISFVAGEVKRPQRNLPLALGLGMAALIAVYLTANVAYLRVLSIPEIAATDRVAATVAQRTMGSAGAALVSLTILLSIAGSINGSIMTSSRIYFAQARDGLFFAAVGRIHPRFETPYISVAAYGTWCAILAVTGSYERLFSYVVFMAAIWYAMSVMAVLILRRKFPDMPRPYKMWGYPVTPLLFTAVSIWFVANTIIERPQPSLIGCLLVAAGIPVYYLWRRAASKIKVHA